MRESQHKRQLKKIRVYCKLVALKLVISKTLDPSEDAIFLEEKIIKISSRQSSGKIICAILHEIGHFIDSVHHPKDFYGRTSVRVSGRLHEREKLITRRDEARKELAKMKIWTPLQKKALDKRVQGKDLTKIQELAFLEISKHLELPRRLRIAFLSKDEIIRKFKLTQEELRINLDIETRAWDFGEKLSRLLGFKVPIEWEKEKRLAIKSYQDL